MRLRRALDALQWGEGRKLHDLEFLIADRAAPGGQRVLSGTELKDRDASFLNTLDGTQIPFHRVLEVRLQGRTVWHKRTRGEKAAATEEEGEQSAGLLDAEPPPKEGPQ